MRRCPQCTHLVEAVGPCPVCGHVPPSRALWPAAKRRLFRIWRDVHPKHLKTPIAVVATRGNRPPPPRRPFGVSAVGFLCLVIGGWIVVQAVRVFLAALDAAEVEELGPLGAEARKLAVIFALLGLCVAMLVLLVSFSFLKGSVWAWWVVLAYYGLGALDSASAALSLPWAVVPGDVAALQWLAIASAFMHAFAAVAICSRKARAFFFPPKLVLPKART